MGFAPVGKRKHRVLRPLSAVVSATVQAATGSDTRARTDEQMWRSNGLCLNCGYDGAPKMKCSTRFSAKKLGAFGTCFPLCFLMFAKHVRRPRLMVVCSRCKSVIVEIKQKRKWWQI